MIDYAKYWSSFLQKELTFYDVKRKKYLKKGYLHFDYRIWFPEFQNAFKKFILNPENTKSHPFFPFLKVTLETKRIRYDKVKHARKVSIKERPICYAAHFDSLIYSFYSTVLAQKYEQLINEEEINESVLAYRSLNLCNIDFAKEVFDYIKAKGNCTAITLDVKGFFDSLKHSHLKDSWLEVLNIHENIKYERLPDDHYKLFLSLTSYSYVRKEDLLSILGIKENKLSKQRLKRYCSIEEFREKIRANEKKPIKKNINDLGIPQGSPISAVLSNIYMIDYDKTMTALAKKMGFLYRRYCDDIIVICNTEEHREIKDKLYGEISKLQLEIQPDKEEIVHFKNHDDLLRGYSDNTPSIFKNLQYLGFEFNGQNTYVRSSSLSRFHRRMKAGVRETIKRAYGKRKRGKQIFRKKLYDRFSHLGRRNFISYVHRASEEMDSPTIKKQVAKHFKHLKNTLISKRDKHERRQMKKGKITHRME